jgi:hypothetical protein
MKKNKSNVFRLICSATAEVKDPLPLAQEDFLSSFAPSFFPLPEISAAQAKVLGNNRIFRHVVEFSIWEDLTCSM